MNISISFFLTADAYGMDLVESRSIKKMYGQEIDAYEKQESTNHEQDLNNFCLHWYQSSLTWCSLLNINCLNYASSKQTVHKVFKMTFWRLSYSF